MDELFTVLKNANVGCKIDDYYYGLISYADDCALLCPSREGLQNMINICEKYFTSHGIKISVNAIPSKSKTKCIAFNTINNPNPIIVYNIHVPSVKSAIYLGHLVSSDENS